jgi:hypothetical protein
VGGVEKPRWQVLSGFLSDDHVEVGFGGLANKAAVVAFVGSPVCTVKSYKPDHFEMKLLDKNTVAHLLGRTRHGLQQPGAVTLLGQFALHKRVDTWLRYSISKRRFKNSRREWSTVATQPASWSAFFWRGLIRE